MNKNYIISLVVLVLLVAGGFYYYQNKNISYVNPALSDMSSGADDIANSTNADGVATDANTITVIYNGTSFVPKDVTVLEGESVTFVNQSGGRMSVASNPHPMHTDYPEFDQYKSPQRGQNSYTFVFEKVGTWGYHDHQNPAAGGTITVIVGK